MKSEIPNIVTGEPAFDSVGAESEAVTPRSGLVGSVESILDNTKQALGIGEEIPGAVTDRRSREVLKKLAEDQPERLDLRVFREEVGTGIFGLRRKKEAVRPRARVIDSSNASSMVDEQGNDARPTGRGKILRPGERMGLLVRNSGKEIAPGDARFPKSSEQTAESKRLKEYLDRKHPDSDTRKGYMRRVADVAQITQARQANIEVALSEEEKVWEGQQVRTQLNSNPIKLETTGISGLLKVIVGGGTWGNSVEVGGIYHNWTIPMGRQNKIPIRHETIAGGSIFYSSDPPKWFDLINTILKRATRGKKALEAPIGRVTLKTSTGAAIGSVTVAHPEKVVLQLTDLAVKASNTNVQPRPIPEPIKPGDLI